ncbi:MAG: Fpg/Nei family DNA glycosylase [Candidatus Hodarchaeota archaeon]
MPELPDLEVAKQQLNTTIVGQTVTEVELGQPMILRRPTEEEFKQSLVSCSFEPVTRYGKFLIFQLRPPARLYLNLMLAGRLALQSSSSPKRKTMGFRLALSGGVDLRYYDVKSMGKAYLLVGDEPTSLIPTFDEQGPDALDPTLTLEVFIQRIRKFQAVIKHVLVNQRFVAGLGNAYTDEILFAARIAPFRKRYTLTKTEVMALYDAMKSVLQTAIAKIQTRTAGSLAFEVRDFLQIHGRAKEPCPRCGTLISSVKSGVRVANFCRRCQV